MKITLNKLTIENMRSTKARTIEFGKDRTVLRGENGTGKTTEADGWYGLINFKDSSGRSNSDIRPIHQTGPNKGDRIRGLVMVSEAHLSIEEADDPDMMNGDWILRKEESEKSREVEKYGVAKIEYAYTKKYWINGDHVLENKFQAWLANIAEPDILRALTDIHFFLADEENGGIHHTKRRKMVRAIAGDIGKPQGKEFDEVKTAIKKRTLEGYKKELTDANAEYEIEKTDSESRRKEKVRDIQAYVAGDYSEPELIRKRDQTVGTIAEIAAEREKVLDQQFQRQRDIDALNALKGDKIKREAILASDTSGTETLRAEAEALRQNDADLRTEVATLNGEARNRKVNSESTKNELAGLLLKRTAIQQEFTKSKVDVKGDVDYRALIHTKDCSGADTDLRDACKTRVDIYDEGQDDRLDDIRQRGNAVQTTIKNLRLMIEGEERELGKTNEARLISEANLLNSEESSKKRLAEIAEEIKACPGKKPEDDDEWTELVAKIEAAVEAIGPPVADVLQELEAHKSGAEAMREKYNKALNAADTVAKDKERLTELEALQKELAQKIVTNNGKLHRIRKYVRAESQLITNAVNGRFSDVEFRLFKLRKNGEVQECCDAMVKGVPYAELSGGETVRAEVDAATVLGTYYGIRAPLFIDDCEHVTSPIDVPTQTIELRAVEGVAELEVVAA